MENQINVDRAKVSIVERLATICVWVNILLYVVIVLSLEQTQGSKTKKKQSELGLNLSALFS